MQATQERTAAPEPGPSPLDRRKSILGWAALLALALALFLMFFVAREASDTMGGPLQRIFYVHVPSAWIAYLAFGIAFIASIAYLRTESERWDILAHSAAEIGVLFCTLVLITGPIWARPVWGTWWQWDARLTSTLVLWLVYIGYLFLRALVTDPSRVGRSAAVVAIVGFVNVPIVHFSVYWWRTLHPQGPAPENFMTDSGLGGQELLAFFTALGAFTLLFAWLLAERTSLARASRRVEALEIERAAAPFNA